MATITLLDKAYGSFSQQLYQVRLASLCRDLKVKVEVVGRTDRDWIQVDLTGDDQKVAMGFLDREIGVAPGSIDNVKQFSAIKGRVISTGEREQDLSVDIGVYSPRIYDATIPLENLQAQLADGKKLPLQRITELFCLYDFMPVHIKVTNEVKPKQARVGAELSETQFSIFSQWISSSLDRLIVLGATESQVERAIRISGHNRDVVQVDAFGLLEHTVICKLGTDAAGLMPRLGPHLYKATLVPFSPRKIRQAIARPFF